MQDKSNEDQVHNHQDKEACDGHPNISRRLPQMSNANRRQADDTLNKLIDCFALQKTGWIIKEPDRICYH